MTMDGRSRHPVGGLAHRARRLPIGTLPSIKNKKTSLFFHLDFISVHYTLPILIQNRPAHRLCKGIAIERSSHGRVF